MLRISFLNVILLLGMTSPVHAALMVTNGGFDNPLGPASSSTINQSWDALEDWYASPLTGFFKKIISYPTTATYLPLNEYYLFLDGENDSVYQSLGIRDANETGIQFEFDAFERGDSGGFGEAFE